MEFLAKGVISARRIEMFMNCKEKEPHPYNFHDKCNKNSIPIRLSQVSAKWSSTSKDATIKNILARAVYSEADVYILDDPFSAVDTEVGTRIFDDCVCGFLKDKTRILVTHQLQFLKSVDGILLLKNGSLQAEGTLEQILKSDIDFLNVLKEEKQENTEDVYDEIDEKSALMKTEAQEQKEVSEMRTVGKHSKGVFWSYLKEVGSPLLVILTLLLGLLYQTFLTGGDLLLSRWLNAEKSISTKTAVNQTLTISEELRLQREWYIQMCSILYISVVIFFLYTFAFYEIVIRSSQRLHQSMFHSVIRTTMLFFHQNPSGRILNRYCLTFYL